ncbi:hypothetical protein AK95_14605 [Paenibacillus sp. LC231]|uniref:hypothetical protein n=1 Tax=Paenibacillus sp. LC231 TaxID=1120679 RepID=UPI0008DD5F16|nr:hypothetical protein [Paenibacillus sp. LC231]OIB04844.1 hypothetical protein AK95_14605 [Paenibacillus sp. LC231]
MAKEIRIIQVAFNVLDPDQLQQYEHVRLRPNQSGFLKRLIQRDIDGGVMGPRQTVAGLQDDFTVEGFI